MGRPPDFVIIGAMKCATTTLHEQLGAAAGHCDESSQGTQFLQRRRGLRAV